MIGKAISNYFDCSQHLHLISKAFGFCNTCPVIPSIFSAHSLGHMMHINTIIIIDFNSSTELSATTQIQLEYSWKER